MYSSLSFCHRILLTLLSAIILLYSGHACASQAASLAEEVRYPLADFSRWRPGVTPGRPEVRGSVHHETVVTRDGGKGASLRLNWNLKRAADSRNNYIRFDFNHRIIGKPEKTDLWVHAEDGHIGFPLKIWLRDASGEIFISRRDIPRAGWNHLVFDFSGLSPAWDSGDRNRVIDLPATLLGIAMEKQDSEGSIVIADAFMTSTGDPSEYVTTTLIPNQSHGIGWGESPSFRLSVANHSRSPRTGLSGELTVRDAIAGNTIRTTRVETEPVPGNADVSIPFSPELAAGVYDVAWQMSDGSGPIPASRGHMRIARMMGDARGDGIGPAERKHVRQWGLPGGIFWHANLGQASRTGAVWERLGNKSQWKTLEPEPGKLDVTRSLAEVHRLNDAGLDIVWFNTVYNQPAFYNIDQEQFAARYGLLHARQAAAFGDLVGCYELGNEDNGPTKFLYTEVARNGAAGVRSQSANALIANSGTAQIDLGWLRLQARRGLFDRLDALVTHPYSWSSSPEAYGVFDQLELVNRIIDDVGGMKIQLTTEFGYPHEFDQLKRAQWIPRHFAIGAAVGLWRHGLYAWDNHFGVYANGRPFPAAATINAFAMHTRAHRFAGWLEKSEAVWAAVFEKAGIPIVMAWSPKGTGHLALPAPGPSSELHDMYGNRLPLPAVQNGLVELQTGESPVYLTNASGESLARAYADSARRARLRLQQIVDSTPNRPTAWIDRLSRTGGESTSDWPRQALLNWKPNTTPLDPTEQALVAQTLRQLAVAVHAKAAVEAKAASSSHSAVLPADNDHRATWRQHLKQSVDADIDLPALRWLLHQWDETRSEMALAIELGRPAYAERLGTLEPIYHHLAAQLTSRGSGVFFPLWPYLHASSEDGKIRERIQFIPGKAVPVKIRLLSYSSQTCESEVSLELPNGWECSPRSWKGTISPGEAGSQTIGFMVTADATDTRSIAAIMTVPGKPVVRIPYDDFEILPPFDVSIPVLSQPLPASPLPIQLVNNGARNFSATLRLLEKPDTPALARTEISDMKPGQGHTVHLQLPSTTTPPPFNEWKLTAEVSTPEGKKFQVPLAVDFDLAVHATTPPGFGGDLSGWEDALPLHLDKEAYTLGSFSSGWSSEDLSGVVYIKWDDRYLYVAARVTDQLFNQELSDADAWNQDSIQIALGNEADDRIPVEFSLALTPKGPQVWCLRGKTGLVADARLNVVLNQGQTLYEAAIPWSAMPAIRPASGSVLRFDVIFNDDDAIINRRVMERYGMGIFHGKKVSDLGYLRLAPPASGQTAKEDGASQARFPLSPARTVFHEDFEEYADGKVPDVWTRRSHLAPVPRSTIRNGVGVANSKCLELVNTEEPRPGVFLSLTRPLTGLVAGQRYRLSAQVKGARAEKTGTILGICSDKVGNEGQKFVRAWKSSDTWQEVQLDFAAPGGDLNIIIRNEKGRLNRLLIDEIRIVGLP